MTNRLNIRRCPGLILAGTLVLLAVSCNSDSVLFDASGVFESTEIIVSSEVNGVLRSFTAGEGDALKAGEEVAQIEVTDLEIQKEQVEARIDALGDKRQNAGPKITVLEQQLQSADASIAALRTQHDVLKKEQARIHRMFEAKAATEQQRDAIDGKVSVLEDEINAAEVRKQVIRAEITSARRSVAIQNRGITSEAKPLEKQKAQIEDRLHRATVRNPADGTLLTKYAYAGEFVSIGKPLYRLANLDVMELRAYIDGSQLSDVTVGQEVEVLIDRGKDDYYHYKGTIAWISDEAEFTPKSIQTKDERALLVYAMKVSVVNDRRIKIGMYGEVNFNTNENEPS